MQQGRFAAVTFEVTVSDEEMDGGSQMFDFREGQSAVGRKAVQVPFPDHFRAASFKDIRHHAGTVSFLERSDGSENENCLVGDIHLSSSAFAVPAAAAGLISSLAEVI